jgi:hypothetical protein
MTCGIRVSQLMLCTKFGEHGKAGWYIGPSSEHYRCYKGYFSDTKWKRT